MHQEDASKDKVSSIGAIPHSHDSIEGTLKGDSSFFYTRSHNNFRLDEGNPCLLCLIDSMWQCRRGFNHARGQVLRYHVDDEVLGFFDVTYRILATPVWTVDDRKT